MVEVKAVSDDAWLTADSDQVSRYWGRYRLVLVTNTRDFVLVGEDGAGRPTKLETFRLAGNTDDFHRKLEKPRVFAREVVRVLASILHVPCRTGRRWLSRRIWPGCSPPMPEMALHGSRRQATRCHLRRYARRSKRRSAYASKATREHASSIRPWCRHSSTASSPLGCCGRGNHRCQSAASIGTKRSGICVRRCCKRCSSNCPSLVACNRSVWSRCWTGPRQRLTAWTARLFRALQRG